MIYPRRLLASILTLLFGALNVSFSLFELDHYNETAVIVALGLLYYLALAATVVGFKNLTLPRWVTWFAFVVAVAMPAISHLQLSSPEIKGKDTWYVTAIAILLSVLAVRGRINFAIFGGLIFVAESLYFSGLAYFPKSGITGAIILIGASIAISRGLEVSGKQILEAQAILSAKRERNKFREAIIEEYEIAFRSIQKRVIPKLKSINAGKHFTKADRESYELLESELRDVISGRRLINNQMRKAVQKARERGVDVALLDESGLEFVPQEQLDELLDIVVSALSEINTGRVTIRTQPEEPWLIRMTASRPRVVTPDLDLKLGER